MSLRKVLALLVLVLLVLTTQIFPLVTAAPDASRGPSQVPKVPAFNYTWTTRETAWNWWNYASFPADKDHLFFVYENKVLLFDLVSNTTKEIANFTYKKDTDPSGPDYNSTLYEIKATKLDDGRYHLGLLENQVENNQTARYLIVMMVAPEGTLIKWDRPVGNKSVLGMDIERALCYIFIYDGMILADYRVWWNQSGNDDWSAFTFGGSGQGAPDLRYVISISYNQSDGYYTVLNMHSGSSWIGVIWLSISGGGHGIGGPYAVIDNDWGVVAMDSSFDKDGTNNNLSIAVMEENKNDGSYRVEFITKTPPYGMHEPIWPGDVYGPGKTFMWPYFSPRSNIAISAGDGVSCIMYPAVPDGSGGLSVPSFITAIFLYKDGTVLGNATLERLVDGSFGSFMVGHSFYVGGSRESSGGSQPPHYQLFIDKVTPHFFGDWGLSDLRAAPVKDIHSVNETLTLIVQPSVDMFRLQLSWMEPCNVNFTVDNHRISAADWPLYPNLKLQPLHIDWTATLGIHNITANLEVPADNNWTNNTISMTVNVGLPDLLVTNLTTNLLIIEPGTPVHVNFTVSNLGADLSYATIELELGSTLIWTRQVQALVKGYEQSFNQTLTTGTYPFGTFDLTLRALPQNSSDLNLSNNQLSVTLRIYNPKIGLVIETPKAQDQVAKTLLVKGHVVDSENETVSVYADLTAGFFTNKTSTVQTKSTFELNMDLSKVVVGRYTLTVHAAGTLDRSAISLVEIFVKNGPYWTLLDPAGNTTMMTENSSMNFSAKAKDWGTNQSVRVNWTFDGKDAAGLKDITIIDGILTYSPRYDGAGLHYIKAEAFNMFGRISRTWSVNVTNLNRPPTISNVTPSGIVKIVLGGHQNFTATAVDPDGDTLNYTWIIGNKTFYGSTITFVPEAAGNSTMFLYISDGKVSSVHQWAVVVIKKGSPPIVPPPPVKHPTTVQSTWLLWVLLVAIFVSIASLVGYYSYKGRPPAKGPAKGLKGTNK